MTDISSWDISKVTNINSMFKNTTNFSMLKSDTSIIISHILFKHSLTYFEEYLRRNQTSENDYEVYVRFVLKDMDSDLEVFEVNSDYPLSEEEHLSLIRRYIRDKKIDELLG